MKYLEPVSLAFHSEVGQGYVLKEGRVCYSDIYRCFKCIVLDEEWEKFFLRVYEVGFLFLFVSLQGLKGRVHVFKIYMCICMCIYENIYTRTHTYICMKL